jgi:hypothetical protein
MEHKGKNIPTNIGVAAKTNDLMNRKSVQFGTELKKHKIFQTETALTATSSHTIFLFLVPFLLFAHWGIDEFLSVQFAFFLLATIRLSPFFILRSKNILFAPSVAIIFLVLSLVAGHDEHMMLKGLRTALVMSLLFAARIAFIQGTQKQAAERVNIIMRALTMACVVSLTVAIAQLLDSLGPNSGLFDVPANFFAIEYGTLFADSRSYLSDTYFIRPSAFYSEPSGLALFGNISVLVGLLGTNKRLIFLGFLTVLISYSVSGFLMCIFIFGYYFVVLERRSNVLLTKVQIISIGGVVLFVGLMLLGSRLLDIGGSSDASTSVRFFEPIRILMDMLNRGEYFGLPPELVSLRMNASVNTIFDNWLINQLLYYGILGVIPIVLLFYCFGRQLGSVIVAIGMTNGDLFYYDRLIFLMLLVVAMSSFKRARGQVQCSQ